MITYGQLFRSFVKDFSELPIAEKLREARSRASTALGRHFPREERFTRIFICVLAFLNVVLFLPFLSAAKDGANTAMFLGPAYGGLVGFSALVIGFLLHRLEGRAEARRERRRRQVRIAHAVRTELVDVLTSRRSFLDVMENIEPEAPVTREWLYNSENFRRQRELPYLAQVIDRIGGFPLELASVIHAAYAEIRHANNFEQMMSSYHKPKSSAPEDEREEQLKAVQRTLNRCGRAVNDLDKWIVANHVD